MNYQETSKILTIYTREFGSMGVIVKGARRAKNKFGASLEPLAHINAILYIKESRELQLLTDAELISSFTKTQQNFDRLFLSLSILELTYIVTRYAERSNEFFDILLEVLYAIESATKSVLILFYYFEAQVIRLLGFKPSLVGCSECSKSIPELAQNDIRHARFDFDRGSFTCTECLSISEGDAAFDLEVFHIWEQLTVLNVKNVMDIGLNRELQSDLDRVMTRYLELHQPEMRTLRAKQMFESIRPE